MWEKLKKKSKKDNYYILINKNISVWNDLKWSLSNKEDHILNSSILTEEYKNKVIELSWKNKYNSYLSISNNAPSNIIDSKLPSKNSIYSPYDSNNLSLYKDIFFKFCSELYENLEKDKDFLVNIIDIDFLKNLINKSPHKDKKFYWEIDSNFTDFINYALTFDMNTYQKIFIWKARNEIYSNDKIWHYISKDFIENIWFKDIFTINLVVDIIYNKHLQAISNYFYWWEESENLFKSFYDFYKDDKWKNILNRIINSSEVEMDSFSDDIFESRKIFMKNLHDDNHINVWLKIEEGKKEMDEKIWLWNSITINSDCIELYLDNISDEQKKLIVINDSIDEYVEKVYSISTLDIKPFKVLFSKVNKTSYYFGDKDKLDTNDLEKIFKMLWNTWSIESEHVWSNIYLDKYFDKQQSEIEKFLLEKIKKEKSLFKGNLKWLEILWINQLRFINNWLLSKLCTYLIRKTPSSFYTYNIYYWLKEDWFFSEANEQEWIKEISRNIICDRRKNHFESDNDIRFYEVLLENIFNLSKEDFFKLYDLKEDYQWSVEYEMLDYIFRIKYSNKLWEENNKYTIWAINYNTKYFYDFVENNPNKVLWSILSNPWTRDRELIDPFMLLKLFKYFKNKDDFIDLFKNFYKS